MAGVNQTKQRFVKLRVSKVDLVDTPANEEPFLAIKRKQGVDPMADKADKTDKTGTVPTDEDVSKDAGTGGADNGNGDGGGDEQVTMESISKQLNELKGEIAAIKAGDGDGDGDGEGGDDGGTETDTSKAGAKMAKGRLAKLEKAVTDLGDLVKELGGADSTETDTSKATNDDDETDVSKRLDGIETTVSKMADQVKEMVGARGVHKSQGGDSTEGGDEEPFWSGVL